VAGNPFTFTVTTTGATITSPAVTIKDGTRTTVTADPSVPTVSQASAVTTVAFAAADTTALGSSAKKNYTYSLQALVNGAGPYELVAGVLSVSPVGTAGTSSTSTAALTVTVGAAALSLSVSLGGDIQAHIDDTSDAHDASAISVLDTASRWTASDVEGVLAEVPLRHGSFVLATDPRFGATGDGSTDDTVALQAFIDYVVTNHLHGFIPAGTYKITDTLDIPERESWIIEGASRHFTIIKQHTNNIPAIAMGSVAGSGGMHSWELKSFSIDYNAAQTGNTSADCILFSAMGYLGTIDNIGFRGGYNGIKVASGIVGFWGCNIDRLWFQQGLRGSCIDMSAGSSAGVPNNRFGSLYTDATNAATAAVLFDIKGTGYTIGQIEANSVNNGNQVLRVNSDTRVTIGSVLIENGAWATGANICEFTGASFFDIGSVWVSGADCAPASGQLALIKMGTGCVGRIGRLQADADTLTGECNLIEAGTAHHIIVDDVIMSGGWTLQDLGSTDSSQAITVTKWANGRTGANKGDAAYTVALGDPNIIRYETTLTASRIVTLPSKAGDNLHAGLSYTIVAYGAINGANTLVIKEGSNTLNTLSTDKVSVTYTWHRSGGAGKWVMTSYSTLP